MVWSWGDIDKSKRNISMKLRSYILIIQWQIQRWRIFHYQKVIRSATIAFLKASLKETILDPN